MCLCMHVFVRVCVEGVEHAWCVELVSNCLLLHLLCQVSCFVFYHEMCCNSVFHVLFARLVACCQFLVLRRFAVCPLFGLTLVSSTPCSKMCISAAQTLRLHVDVCAFALILVVCAQCESSKFVVIAATFPGLARGQFVTGFVQLCSECNDHFV